MKGIVIVSPKFFKLFMASWAKGITLFPFIILKDEKSRNETTLIQHEQIHIRQQIEMLILFFYIWYIVEYLIRRIQTGSWRKAYQNISFEKEAYAHQHNNFYLKERPFWEHIYWL
ncbi:MAG: hypothetical protein LC105_12830 [Chitinophagales bacterium]|nr:hypothetical protein [Chitinophagales bacterium]MCZ2394739.1 hypothetical protein [Chitinophagales bacterium]